MGALVDPYKRTVNYLRISITDRCDLRCLYCVPRGAVKFSEASALLSLEEIARVAGIASGLGITKIRLTGGEPLVRSGAVDLVCLLARLPGIREIAMTTNGTRLVRLAAPLRAAGLTRLNVSLDTMDPERFRRISGNGALPSVLDGIEAAIAAGFTPLKINTVVLRGVNDDEMERLVDFAASRGAVARFIEFMPFAPAWRRYHVPRAEILARLAPALHPEPMAPEGSEPATYYRLRGRSGTVGIISPIGCAFCDRCNRLRLTADGFLRPCLFREGEVDLKTPLRAGAADADVASLMRDAVARKPVEGPSRAPEGIRSMREIGG